MRKRKQPNRFASEHQSARRLAGWNRIYAEQGKLQPTEAQRKRRREYNQRYQEKLKKRQAEQPA